MDHISWVPNLGTSQETWLQRESLWSSLAKHPEALAPLTTVSGLEEMILHGMPIDALHTSDFSDRVSGREHEVRCETNGLEHPDYSMCNRTTKELRRLSGNGMSVRCVMASLAVALKSVHPKYVEAYLSS